MSDAARLRTATVQDIQLELLRRTVLNALNGGRVRGSLLKHRHLWLTALLDRVGLPNYADPGRLLMAGLIKLRDLPDNLWNADTLFVLTPTRSAAEQLKAVAEAEDWGGEVSVYTEQDELDRAHGTGRQEFGLLSVWWD